MQFFPDQIWWWAQVDSNHRPHAYQACALTSWAMSPYLRLEAVGFSLPLSPFCAMQSFHFAQLRVHSAFPCGILCARRTSRLSLVVEMNGIEPMTPCLQSRCSPSWATPPYSIEHRASLFCCSAHSVSSWKLVYFLLIKKAKFGLPNFQCTYKVCTIGPSKLNNTYKSNFVIPDLGC